MIPTIREVLRTLTPRPQSLAATLMALAILSAAAGGGVLGPDAQRLEQRASPVGEADAIACGGACLVGVGLAVSFGAGYVANEYLSGDDTTAGEYLGLDANETHLQLSAHADTIGESQETLTTVQSNQVNDGSRSVVWAKAKAAAVKEMNAGGNESETKAAARQAVQDYYSTVEVNVINSRSEAVKRAVFLEQSYDSNANLSGAFVEGVDDGSNYGGVSTFTADYTLRNGTVVQTTHFERPDGSYSYPYIPYSDLSNSTAATSTSFAAVVAYNPHPQHTPSIPAEENPSYGVIMDLPASQALFNDIQSANTQMVTNAETWVDQTYPEYSSGDINESDILDPVTLSQEFATDYNSTGFYQYAAADLALQGTNGTLNESMTFDLHSGSAGRTSNQTLNGTLFTDWQPSSTGGTWETGHTYNASNSSSLVYVASNDGLRVVDGKFHITEMTNVQTGEAVQNTTLENYNRQTADAGWNQTQYQQLIELQQKLDEQQAAAAGAGGLFGDVGSTPILLALGAAVVFLLGRSK